MSGLGVSRQNDTLLLSGTLRMGDIVPALAGLKAQCAKDVPQTIDLAGVTACDSAGVALMLELKRMGVATITNVPSDMDAIVHACQMEGLMPTNRRISDEAEASLNHNENS